MRYEMTGDTATIGHQRGNTVTLSGDPGLSRTHCRIRSAGRGFVVEDAGSTNGTRLNGRRIQAAEPLCSGDKIRIGSTEIAFDDPLSPKRSWLARLKQTVLGGGSKPRSSEASRTTSDGTVFGDGFVKCGKCGARIHTGSKGPGQKVGCSRCRSVYTIP
ncbi:MAG: FHA domain-containing protein [Planctomycetota bacterium]